ncbi:hypothetical protein B7463_g10604, partial [Scytalidium lignicola]
MMTSLAQAYSPHPVGLQQHPGVPQGHPMAGVPHNPGPQGGQPGPGMPQQMHMGVSGPGPQVTQAGALMGGMPPGAGGPSAHALSHLNPAQAQQAQLYQQQQAMNFANNPQLQQMQQQQQQMIQHQRQQAARQALMAQQYGGMPVGMPNGMNQMSAAQFAAMRGTPIPRPVNLPQHLQAQQQAMEQQQAQQQAQHQHQQQLMAQQLAMQQHAAQAQGGTPGQPGQMGPQQLQNLQQAQLAAQQQHQQQQQQQAQAAAAAAQQNHGQGQGPHPPQQGQQNSQGQLQQPQTPGQQQASAMQQHQAATAAALMQQHQQQQRQGDKMKGQCIMRLIQFGDHLSNFGASSKPLEAYMANGVSRLTAQGNKQRDDLNYWLAFVDRFFSTRGLVATGTLRAHFDAEQKIELLEFVTSSHEEYLPKTRVIEAARPVHEWVKDWHKFAEVMGQMNPLFNYAHLNPSLAPYAALDQYVTQIAQNGVNGAAQPNMPGPRTPGMANFPMGASPATAHLQLPDGSPHIGGSPAQGPNMQLQQSQQGTNSSGPSANTSPNTTNKRRRPSTVKAETESTAAGAGAQANGTQAKPTVKPSPRIGGKRQKGNPA